MLRLPPLLLPGVVEARPRLVRHPTRRGPPMRHPRRHILLLPMPPLPVRRGRGHSLRGLQVRHLHVLDDDLLPRLHLALDDRRVWGDDERLLLLRGVEELAVAAEAGGLGAARAPVPFVEPDDDADYPGDADDPARDGPGEDGRERAVAGVRMVRILMNKWARGVGGRLGVDVPV